MSVATHSIHAFLPLPFLMFPSTSKLLHLETQSSAVLRSTCPYHLNLPRLTTLSTLSIPNPCLSSSRMSRVKERQPLCTSVLLNVLLPVSPQMYCYQCPLKCTVTSVPSDVLLPVSSQM